MTCLYLALKSEVGPFNGCATERVDICLNQILYQFLERTFSNPDFCVDTTIILERCISVLILVYKLLEQKNNSDSIFAQVFNLKTPKSQLMTCNYCDN